MYRYFYNPTSMKLVTYLPETLAPNLITLIGFFFSSLPFFVLFGMFGDRFNNIKEIPPWFYILEAVCLLVYRMLDEMDGKQARRTGNASPLGLLFDHGCDSFTMGMQTMIIVKTLQVGDSLLGITTVLFPCASFFFSTLEEYYTGGLFLLPGNGVTDGSLGIYVSMMFMAYFGNDYWKDPYFFVGTPNEIILKDFMAYLCISIQIMIIS